MKSNKGFTIIELLNLIIVIVIISIVVMSVSVTLTNQSPEDEVICIE